MRTGKSLCMSRFSAHTRSAAPGSRFPFCPCSGQARRRLDLVLRRSRRLSLGALCRRSSKANWICADPQISLRHHASGCSPCRPDHVLSEMKFDFFVHHSAQVALCVGLFLTFPPMMVPVFEIIERALSKKVRIFT